MTPEHLPEGYVSIPLGLPVSDHTRVNDEAEIDFTALANCC